MQNSQFTIDCAVMYVIFRSVGASPTGGTPSTASGPPSSERKAYYASLIEGGGFTVGKDGGSETSFNYAQNDKGKVAVACCPLRLLTHPPFPPETRPPLSAMQTFPLTGESPVGRGKDIVAPLVLL